MSYSELFDEVIEVAENEEKSPPRRKENVKKRLTFDTSGSPFSTSREARGGTPNDFRRRGSVQSPFQSPYNSSNYSDTFDSRIFDSSKNSTVDSRFFESSMGQSSYLLGSPDVRMFATPPPQRSLLTSPSPVRPARVETESIIEWFDKSVEAELQRRQQAGRSPKLNLLDASGASHHLSVGESTICSIDLETSLRGGMATALEEAVESFLMAQAHATAEGARQAAEKAAALAPPELAEEAAIAGAKDYQAELTSVVKQKIPGVKPVEVIGYVGITRPKFRKRKV